MNLDRLKGVRQMRRVRDIPDQRATPFRISHKIAQAGTVAGNPTGAVSGMGFFSYYYVSVETTLETTFIQAEDYPVLAELWDNEADAIYDDL